MSLDDQEKFEGFGSSGPCVEDCAAPDDEVGAKAGSRELFLGDAEISPFVTGNADRRRALMLLGGSGPVVSSGGEDAEHPEPDDLTLGQTGIGENVETPESRETIFSTQRDIPRMKKIIVEYVAGLPGEVTKLLELMNLRDLQPLRRVAHQLRGSGGGYGFDVISELAGKVEDSIASGGTLVDIRVRVLSLVGVICRVDGYVDSHARAGWSKDESENPTD